MSFLCTLRLPKHWSMNRSLILLWFVALFAVSSCNKKGGTIFVQNVAAHPEAVVTVLLDGANEVTLRPGESVEYEADYGSHAIAAQSASCSFEGLNRNFCNVFVARKERAIITILQTDIVACTVELDCLDI